MTDENEDSEEPAYKKLKVNTTYSFFNHYMISIHNYEFLALHEHGCLNHNHDDKLEKYCPDGDGPFEVGEGVLPQLHA